MEFRTKLAASLLAIFIIFATGAEAANQDYTFQADFTPDSHISGGIEIRLQNNTIEPALIYLKDSGGRRIPVDYSSDNKSIVLSSDSGISDVTEISFIFRSRENNDDILRAKIYSRNSEIRGHWDFPVIQTTGTLLDIIDSLSIGRVAVSDTHSVSFTITTTPISDSGEVWILFRDGFDISSVSNVLYRDNDPDNDGNEPIISQIMNDESAVIFRFQPGGLHAKQDSRISLKFWPVINDSLAQNYRVIAMTTAFNGEIENAPAESDLFSLSPDDFQHIIIAPDTAVTVISGSLLQFSAVGKDRFGNTIPDLIFTYDVTVDSCGQVSDNSFQAIKLGSCYITVSADGLTDSTGLITIIPGPLARFSMIGYPSSRIAGQPFSGDVTVTALDAAGNRKHDYLGELWFSTGDSVDDLPYEFDNSFTFVDLDSGQANFAGAGFILKRAGVRTLTATNASIGVSSNPIRVTAANIDTFVMTASTPQVAGEAFYVNIDAAQDSFGNLSSGEIAVTDSIGGGNSPDGIPPSHNNIIVTNGTGRALQVLTNAVPTMLKGVLVGGSAESTTPLIQILPGTLGSFLFAGYPDFIVAGNNFPLQIRVAAYDLFGNIKNNYEGSVYFTSSDPLAQLPYTQSSPFQFLPQDNGNHSFTEPFSLRTSGGQVISVTDGTIETFSQTINVTPALISHFTLNSPGSISAGVAFAISAVSAIDSFGNPANGTIVISDTIGGGPSPNGAQPIFNDIQVISGSGSANQTLVNSITTTLKGTIGSIINVTNPIVVNPGELGRFDLDISSPQVVGVPFTGTATLAAFDRFDNPKVDFDASADTVVISSSTEGLMTNNILRLSNDFNLGVADLVAKGTTYNGRGGPVTFIATSQSHVIDNSSPIDVNAIRCGSLGISQYIMSPGDTATGTISVTNLAGADVNVTDLIVLDSFGWSAHPSSSPGLPNVLGPGESRTYNITLPIPSEFPNGIHPLTAGVRGLFSSFTVADTIQGYPDTISIEVESLPVFIAGSLGPDTLSSGSYYSFSARIGNSGTAGIALLDSSYMLFTDGIRQFKAAMTSPVFLPPNAPSGVLINFDSALVANDFSAGSYLASFNYFGHENGFFRHGIVAMTDSIWIQSRATLNYVSGSLNIDSLAGGQSAAFTIQVNNSGTADFVIRHQETRISMIDASHEFVAYSDTVSGNRNDILRPGTTTFHFRPTILPSDFSHGNYLPNIQMSGTQNGFQENITFTAGTDSVKVLSPAVLRIDSTYAMSLNAPFVNTSQPCSLKVLLRNLGDEGVDAFSLMLHNNGNGPSTITDSIYVPHLDGNSVYQAIFVGTAGSTPNPNEVFISTLMGGVGVMSGNPARIIQSLDNTALLVTETPAELSISDITIVSPPEAFDDTIATNQGLVISVSVINLGQADIGGPRRLFLNYGSIPWGADSLFRDFTLAQDVTWNLLAPTSPHESATLQVMILSGPTDLNDGSSALGSDTITSHTFVIEMRPFITQNGGITSPDGAIDGTISTDQTFVITDTLQSSGLYSLRGARLFLPDGFTTQDSLVKYPSENIVTWRLRAPANATSDTAVVQCWVVDSNTGDSIGTAPDYIPIAVVSAAALRISTAIVGPPAAADGIVEPGGSLIFEAIVQNLGQAAVSDGEVLLQTGRIDMVPTENPIRNFSIDIPVDWTISIPGVEVPLPVPISASLYTIPTDENSGLPARVITDSSSISVLIRELYPRLMIENITSHDGSVARGQQINYLSFDLHNSDVGANFPIAVAGFTFEVISGAPVNAILSSVTMSSDSGNTTSTAFNGNTVSFSIDTVYLASASSLNFRLSFTLSENTTVGQFSVRLRHDFVDAVVYENDHPSLRLYALSSRGEEFNWQGNPVAILEQTFAASLSSYPNPFNPRVSATKIGYYLPVSSDLEIRVFTLTGELVWTKIISASEEYGTAGLHTGQNALSWDGTNDIGKEIRSGVYICIVKNLTTGEEEKFKIAIVK